MLSIKILALLAVIAEAQGWEDMENYGISKQPWLSEVLELPHGLPSDDTFRRVFDRIKPEALEQFLSQWLQHLMGSLAGEIVPLVLLKNWRQSITVPRWNKFCHHETNYLGEKSGSVSSSLAGKPSKVFYA